MTTSFLTRRLSRLILLLLAALLPVSLLAGCASAKQDYNSISDLQACRNPVIGFEPDLDYTQEITALLPNASIKYYNMNDGYEALRQGKLDAFLQTASAFNSRLHNGLTGVKMLDEPVLVTYDIAIPYSSSCAIPDLGDKLNAFIAEMKANGTLDDLYNRWTVEYNTEMPEIPQPENPEYTLTVGTNGQNVPYCYLENGQITGAEIELAYRLGAYLNAEVVFQIADYPGLTTGLASGRYDVLIANIFLTEDRASSVLYSEPYYQEEVHFLVRDSSSDTESGIMHSLYRTLIEQDRWKTILSGLGTTLVITLAAFLLANLLGILFCRFGMSRAKGLNILYDIYQRLMQGTPIVVLLMLLYYAVFGSTSLSGEYIAVLAFGMSSGASLAQQFCGALRGVDRGQWEAGCTLGFTKRQVFRGVILPQITVALLPGWCAELINLMKGTAFVGYIAVVDLTRAGDLIRSATFEAYAPLLIVAALYLLIASLMITLTQLLLKHIDPATRKRTLKGVKLRDHH